jgi:hypothetical protein
VRVGVGVGDRDGVTDGDSGDTGGVTVVTCLVSPLLSLRVTFGDTDITGDTIGDIRSEIVARCDDGNTR